MLPAEAVARLAEIVAARTGFTEDDIYTAMAAAGIPGPAADRAYKFTQIAWGRALLDGLGVTFSGEYIGFDAAGEVIESGRLAEQPYYIAAVAAVGRFAATPGFQQLALMSAEVHGINELLHKGSKPENIVTSPSALFLEAPTPAGLERAQQHLEQLVRRARKPWWRFW